MREYYFDHCDIEEQQCIDGLTITMNDNMHRRSTVRFSPASALEILGALIQFLEDTARPGWHPRLTVEDIERIHVRNHRVVN